MAYAHGVMLDNDDNPGFQVLEDPPNAGPGDNIRTYFAVPRTVLEQALKDADLLDAVDGQTVYIHSIFRIENSPKNAGKLFYTLEDILAAENWSQETRENLRMRFDNPITFQSPFYDGDVVRRLVHADSTVEELPPVNVVKGVKSGTPFSYTLEDTVGHNGKTFRLYKSYIRLKLKPNEELYPQFEGDPALKTRNTTIAVGGTDIVGVYREVTQKPDLVTVDITADGPIEAEKPVSFTAKWKVADQATGKPYNVSIMVNGTQIKLESQAAGQPGEYTMNFTYTFTDTSQKTFLLIVDSTNAIDESNENNNQVSKMFKAADPNRNFTGDFDVLPPAIEFRESFQLKPKNFTFNGCTYDGHRYKIERDGLSVYTPWADSQSYVHSYSYSTYPSVIGIGTHFITLEIRTKDCGMKQTATHTLVVNGPSHNRPPEFEIGFVHPYNPTKPVHEVVEGTVMHLIYITDPSVPTPHDPDGDPIEFLGFDFSESSNWAKTIPQNYPEYGDGYHNIVMNGLGYHVVKASMRDAFGATATRTTYIRVIPPNPIPVIEGPKEVKEGRPLPQPFSSAKSYSPAGRAIDHSRDEWGNLKEVYTKPGKEIITLHVYDSIGLKSLEPAVHELTVLPDEPPVAKLEVEPRGIRGQTYYVYNKSYSPDGEQIVSVQYKMRYDAENNGFDDDPWTNLNGDMTRAVFKPDRVGKYQFYVKVCEDYGKCDDTLSDPVELTMIDIVNLAPEVSFELEGKNPQPDHSVARIYTPAEMFGWTLTDVNSTSPLDGKRMRWSYSASELFGKSGKKPERFYGNGLYIPSATLSYFPPFSDAGYGKNGYNLYRPIGGVDPNKTFSQPLLVPNPNSEGKWNLVSFSPGNLPNFVSTPTHLYFSYNERFYALNKSKIGRYELQYIYTNGRLSGVEHTLPDGSYYDYILHAPNAQFFAEVRHWAGEPIKFVEEHEKVPGVNYAGVGYTPVEYYVTDDTVYQVVEWRCYCGLYSDGERFHMGGYTLFTYDLKTGELIASGLKKGINYPISNPPRQGFSRNGNLVYLPNYSNELQTYDRYLNLKSRKQLQQFPYDPPASWLSCSGGYKFDKVFEDINENTYVYEEVNCYNGDEWRNYGSVYLVKFDPDFNVVWRAKLEGTDLMPNIDVYTHDVPDMIVNHAGKEIIVRSYQYFNTWAGTKYIQAVNMDTGATRILESADFAWNGTTFDIDAFGQMQTRSSLELPYSYTPYGIKFRWSGNRYYGYTWTGQSQYSFEAGGILSTDGYTVRVAHDIRVAQYVGDGLLLSLLTESGTTFMYYWTPWLNVGVPVEGERQGPGFTLGQLLSSTKVKDHELSFTLSLDDADADRELVGMSFRAADAANRYAFETNGSTIFLSKYVNGKRTVLAQQSFPFQDREKVLIKLRFSGDKLQLYVNNAPYFNVTDSTFREGKFGPFSNKSYVRFGPVSAKEILPDQIYWYRDYAIWDEGSAKAEVRYKNISFVDPENDPPAGSYQWSITHTPRFLNNQGLSALHGKTFSSPVLEFDKVGDYTVILRAKDDPHPEHRHPDPTFEEYRQPSNEFTAVITVHRRPIADKWHSIASDGTILWFDRSHDPDRWISDTEYSTEPTGIDYKTTRGILEKKFYYITPSGRYVAEKLVVPDELGTYIIGMAVKDEYGAWSEYDVDFVTVTKLPEPNEPPVAAFTVNPSTTYRGVQVTIESQSRDKEDGGRENLKHTYYLKNLTTGGPETVASASRTVWTKTFSTLGTFQIRLVVEDSLGQPAQAVKTVTIVNRKPQANVTTPASTSTSNPTKFDVLRPTFVWTYSDADGDAQSMFQVQIYRLDGTLERDTGPRSGSVTSWTPAVDLPERVTMYVRVRAHDGIEWGDWSAPKYFYIETNRPPVADFDWTPKPVYEGDTVQLIDRSSDPDGDPLTYDWQITGPGGRSLAFNAKEPSFRAEQPGSYTIRLVVSDGRETAQAERVLEALPLTIDGEVHHTPEWRKMHEEAGHEVDRDPKDFYSGEIIRVAAVISEAPADEVTAELEAVSKSGGAIRKQVQLKAAGGRRYEGELHDKSWMTFDGSIREGEYPVVFRVRYRNGTVKETSVPIRIIGNIHKHVSVHRVR
ncbi:MAG: hypothetical protein A9Z00_12000 [Thermobacillus sp. ZCTH02-B1]|nr:MAG: hypothetical protein A9Z00_12000 [Thermobacillus sp. ZCTH02-B1]